MALQNEFAAVALAAGKGERMRSRVPKPLHRVCGREMVALAVDAAIAADADDVVVVTPPDDGGFRAALGDRARYVAQPLPIGSGDALMRARDAVGGARNVLVMYGDVPLVLPGTLKRLMRRHIDAEACATILTSTAADPEGKGRVVRGAGGDIVKVVEQPDADEQTLAVREVNCGIYCFRAAWLWDNLAALSPSASGEVYLTDLIAVAAKQAPPVAWESSDDPDETMGVNDRAQLADAEAVMRDRIRRHWLLQGVTMPHPESVYIDHAATLGQDTIVMPNTHIVGAARIGSDCRIGPNSVIENSDIGDDCQVTASVVRDSTIDANVDVGPFSLIRRGAHIHSEAYIGFSSEVKNSRVGPRSKIGHFGYMGDATLGADVNIGAGTATCGYDGVSKHETHIGDGAFIGCDTMLVAPVAIGDRAYTGAGAVITKDVPDDALVFGVPAKARPQPKPEYKP